MFGGLAFATSPIAVVQLIMILAQAPIHMLRSVAGFFVPALFAKDVTGETIVITVRREYCFTSLHCYIHCYSHGCLAN